MSVVEKLAREAFDAGRERAVLLYEASTAEGSEGEVPLYRFYESDDGEVRFASGKGVHDIRPVPRSATWTDFCLGIQSYAATVIGESEEDKERNSKYILAGEIKSHSGSGSSTVGGLASGLPGTRTAASEAGHRVEAWRADADVIAQTMLVLDCDAPVSPAPLCRLLSSIDLAFCVAPTWAATVDSPRWRCFLPVAPTVIGHTEVERDRARWRYAWLAGLLAGLAELPVACPACDGSGASAADPSEGGRLREDGRRVCRACLGGGTFRFDLSCWNHSRLHFAGGRKSASVPLEEREVFWGKGFGLDCEAWLEATGFSEWSATAAAEVAESRPRRGALGAGGDGSDGELGGHPDPEIAAAMSACPRTLLERVRRACMYIGSPDFPASVSGRHGSDALMRACAAVVSGFLVPLEHAGEEWALRCVEVAFNPRCTDEAGDPYPWSSREVRKKLADVRCQAGAQPGALLARSSDEGARFYVVRADGSQGCQPADAGVYGAAGEQLSTASRSGALLDLSADAARACPIDPFDPHELPAGFRPRRAVIGIADGRAQERAAERARALGQRQSLAVGALGTVGGAAQAVGSVAVAGAVGGGAAGGVGGLGSLRSIQGGRGEAGSGSAGGGSGGERKAAPGMGSSMRSSKIPAERDWTSIVQIDDDQLVYRQIVEQMNQSYAYVHLARDGVIVDTRASDARRGDRAHMSIAGFFTDQKRYPLRVRKTGKKAGEEKMLDVNRAELWLSSPYRREYEEWAFAPELSPEECEAVGETGRRRILNTFRGFLVKPDERGLALFPSFAELVDEVIADGDEAASRYLWTWLANIFQNPADKPGIALYLYSLEGGVGKGTFFQILSLLLGRYYLQTMDDKHITGQWNLHLADKLLVFFDEARALKERQNADKLNSLITEPEFAASEKFMPLQRCQNYTRFAFASNKQDGVEIPVGDRRFAAFRVSSRKKGHAAFWRRVWREALGGESAGYGMSGGAASGAKAVNPTKAAKGAYAGLSGLIYHLLHVVRPQHLAGSQEPEPDLRGVPASHGGGVDLRVIVQTKLRREMQVEALKGVEKFVYIAAVVDNRLGFAKRSLVLGGRVEQQPVEWPQTEPFEVLATEFTELYNDWAKRAEQPSVGAARKQLTDIFQITNKQTGSIEFHPDFRDITGDAVGGRRYRLPSGIEVARWLMRKHGW